MCKTGFGIREDGIRCKVCQADGAVTPLLERADNDGDLEYCLCEICEETEMEQYVDRGGEDFPVLTYEIMAVHINRATNIAVEQISARMIEYLDSMGESRG